MNDADKTRQQLIAELQELRQRVAAAEQAARAGQAATALLHAAPLGIHKCDCQGRITYVNAAQEAITGYTADELLGSHVWDRIPPGPEKDALPAYLRHLVAQQPPPTPFFGKNVKKNGDLFDVRIDWNYTRDARGEVTGFACIVTDITDSKRAEEELLKAKEFSDGLFHAMQDGFSVLDKSGAHVDVNDAFCRMTDFSRQELLGAAPPHPYWPPESRADIEAAFRASFAGKSLQFELVFMRKNGQRFPVIVAPSLVKDEHGNLVSCFATVKDITDRKRVEAELRAERNRAQQYLDVAGVIMVVLDNAGQILLLNRKGGAVLGYDNDDLLGKNWFDTCLPLRMRDQVKAVFAELIAGRMTSAEYYDNPVVTRSGEERVMAWHNALLTDDAGAVVGTLSSGVDITDRRRAEESLRKARDELEQKVKDRTAELAIFQKFAEASGQGFGMSSLDGRLIYANPTLCRLFGEERLADAVGKHVSAYYLAGFYEKRQNEIIPAVMRDGHWKGELAIHSRQGNVVPILQDTFLIRDENGNPLRLAAAITDITARKQAEEALRTSEERYRAVVEDQTEVICRLKADGTFLFVNDVYCRFFGKTSAELLGAKWHPTALADDLPTIEERLRTISPDHPIVVIENRVYSATGEIRWMQFVNRGFFDQDGRLLEVQAVGRDVTDRRRAEEALQASEEKYRGLIEACPDAVVMTDFAGRVLFASRPTWRLLGLSESDELLGHSVFDAVAEEDRPRLAANFKSLLALGVRRGTEYRTLRTDGSTIFAEASSALIRDAAGQPTAVMALLRDVTERRQARAALQASEEKYRLLVETTDTGYLILDGQGRVVDANAEYVRISGHQSLQDILGRTVVQWTAPRDVDRNAKEVERCLREGFVRHLEIDYVHSDGKTVPMEINATCLDTDDGRRIVSLCRDISERRQAQEALQREHQSLWHMLQASDHERQTISYEIHDGLAQYLAAAGMQFQAFEAQRADSPQEAQKAYETAVELVRQSHFEARRLISEVRPPVIDETGIETAISHLVHEQRRHGGPKLEYRCNVQFGRLPSILEDSLYRIAQEALTNACQHSQSKRAAVTLTQEGQDIRLQVRDWGIGFDPESVQKGHFGLEGIRQRVRLLGGRLKIESAPDSGTLVQVIVPILERQAED